jgi:hypothetical protein
MRRQRIGQLRILVIWVPAVVVIVAGLAAVLGIGKVLAWVAAAVLAGVAATITGLVQGSTKKRLTAGKHLLAGSPVPFTVATEYWQQPLDFLSGPHAREVRCGFVVLLVQTTAEQAVVLKRLRVVIDSRGPGIPLPADPPHAPLAIRRFLLDLDSAFPELRPEAFAGATPDFPYAVTSHDPENFQIMAYTDHQDVRWHLELDWICGNNADTMVIDHNGQPFRVAQPPDAT